MHTWLLKNMKLILMSSMWDGRYFAALLVRALRFLSEAVVTNRLDPFASRAIIRIKCDSVKYGFDLGARASHPMHVPVLRLPRSSAAFPCLVKTAPVSENLDAAAPLRAPR